MNVAQIEHFSDVCTGCAACFNICPKKAISMRYDNEEFLVPHIDSDRCINCGNCADVCQIIKKPIPNSESINEVYAFQANDYELLMNATSGGLFPVLAKYFIENNGVVFGAAYNENMEVVHKAIYNNTDIKQLNGSKYIQSSIGDTYAQTKELLELGKMVLYSGTPCQINGLKLFLNKEYDNLLTVDVICYGTPSIMFLKKYIEMIEKKEHAKVVDFRFRDKHKYGWSHTVVITFNKNGNTYKKIYGNEYNNLWYRAWKECDCLRECCYNCDLISKKRYADITMGNFWGIDKVSDSFNNKNGVSFLLINNVEKKGILKLLKQEGILEEQGWKMVDVFQHGLRSPKIRRLNRNDFYIELNKGYENLINKLYSAKFNDVIFKFIPIPLQSTVNKGIRLIKRTIKK